MGRKAATVLGFIVGALIGYHFAIQTIEYYGLDVGSYWSAQGTQVIRAMFTLGMGFFLGVVCYFVANYFSGFD